MRKNNQTNTLIKCSVIAGDFVVLNAVLAAFLAWHPRVGGWRLEQIRLFILICNIAMAVSQWHNHTIIHKRVVSGGEVLQRTVFLTMTQAVLAYLLMKWVDLRIPVGWVLLEQGTVCFILILILRLTERTAIKWYRQRGGNSRTITFVGSDPGMLSVYHLLINDPTTGYKIIGYYADKKIKDNSESADENYKQHPKLEWLGTTQFLIDHLEQSDQLKMGDDLYVCLPIKETDFIQRLSLFCDQHMIKFYYIPISAESLQLHLQRESFSDVEVYTTHKSLLQYPQNRIVKRLFDIVASALMLALVGLFMPFIALIIKRQSPGPLFFRQLRTGLDGKPFMIYKFRSMHINKEADSRQATENDARKFPFGNFLRKTSIDELPQLWNVLKGDMSIVGPRPHMLTHTKKYSQLIDKYLVRHIVKPGMTGWSQVTGFRGETKELWQMEERVRRDIWYIEHWDIWLDLRIIKLTAVMLFHHDRNAY